MCKAGLGRCLLPLDKNRTQTSGTVSFAPVTSLKTTVETSLTHKYNIQLQDTEKKTNTTDDIKTVHTPNSRGGGGLLHSATRGANPDAFVAMVLNNMVHFQPVSWQIQILKRYYDP